MEKLPYKNKYGHYEACGDTTTIAMGYGGSKSVVRGNVVDRLAAYEDTGLEPDEIPQLKAQLDAVLEDLYYIHCAGQKGCAICRNADQCGEQDSHIGDCVGFEWRGPQPLKEEK